VAMVRMREGQGEAIKTYERGFPVGRIDVSLMPALGMARCRRAKRYGCWVDLHSAASRVILAW